MGELSPTTLHFATKSAAVDFIFEIRERTRSGRLCAFNAISYSKVLWKIMDTVTKTDLKACYNISYKFIERGNHELVHFLCNWDTGCSASELYVAESKVLSAIYPNLNKSLFPWQIHSLRDQLNLKYSDWFQFYGYVMYFLSASFYNEDYNVETATDVIFACAVTAAAGLARKVQVPQRMVETIKKHDAIFSFLKFVMSAHRKTVSLERLASEYEINAEANELEICVCRFAPDCDLCERNCKQQGI